MTYVHLLQTDQIRITWAKVACAKVYKKITSALFFTAFPSSVFPKAAMTIEIKQCMANGQLIAVLFIKLPYESEVLNWLHNRSLDPN